jgi:multisubunit Na+/H+ antiporter MnhC subunit
MNPTLLNVVLISVLCLVGVGFYALLTCRNLLKIVIALQILVKSALLALVSAGSAAGRINLAQSLVITAIVADTVVAVFGMALAVQVRRQLGTFDVSYLSKLRG